jgi:hypothetical protein
MTLAVAKLVPTRAAVVEMVTATNDLQGESGHIHWVEAW